MLNTIKINPTSNVQVKGSFIKIVPVSTAISGTRKVKDATLLDSPEFISLK